MKNDSAYILKNIYKSDIIQNMKPHFSLAQYKAFDLASFAVILGIAEVLITLAGSKWFPDQL